VVRIIHQFLCSKTMADLLCRFVMAVVSLMDWDILILNPTRIYLTLTHQTPQDHKNRGKLSYNDHLLIID